jgi:hypothetical protein
MKPGFDGQVTYIPFCRHLDERIGLYASTELAQFPCLAEAAENWIDSKIRSIARLGNHPDPN